MGIQNGDVVRIHYTGRLEDGKVFDSSEGREPLQFQVGAGQVIPGFENAVIGLEPGEEKTVTVPPEEGYGERDPAMVKAIGRDQIDIDPEVGQVLGLEDQEGNKYQATVREVGDEAIELDFNHFLAGETLHFDVTIAAVEQTA